MTTEPIRDTETIEEPLPPIDSPEPNPIISEIDRLNQVEVGEGTEPDEVQEAPAEEAPAPAPPIVQQEAGQVEGPPSQPQPQPQPRPQYSPEEIQQMETQARQYEEQQRQLSLQSQADQYRRQLESQGYMPEQAQQAAGDYMQSQQRQMEVMKQAEDYGQHLQGQMLAAEHFVKQYKLGIEDLSELRKYHNPQAMEGAAKKLATDRERDTELTRLRQAQVPAQQFDNSQGEPSVAPNDSGWLDRYNSGDRSPNSVAAARRATGLE